MAGQIPEHGSARGRAHDPRWDAMTGLLFAILLNAAIIGLFMFITWVTYATD